MRVCQGWEEKRRWSTILGADLQDLAKATIFDQILSKQVGGGTTEEGAAGIRVDGIWKALSGWLGASCHLWSSCVLQIPADVVYEDDKVRHTSSPPVALRCDDHDARGS